MGRYSDVRGREVADRLNSLCPSIAEISEKRFHDEKSQRDHAKDIAGGSDIG
jgi:hypothetical protein